MKEAIRFCRSGALSFVIVLAACSPGQTLTGTGGTGATGVGGQAAAGASGTTGYTGAGGLQIIDCYKLPGMPGASACAGKTIRCAGPLDCTANGGCQTLSAALGHSCSGGGIVPDAWESICGSYVVVSRTSVDTGDADFYDRASGILVATVWEGNGNWGCQGPTELQIPACSNAPYCAVDSVCKSQVRCSADAGTPDGLPDAN